MNVAFPLRDNYFQPLQATPEDRAQWTQRVQELVQQTLVEEQPFFASGYEVVDSRQWKLVRRKDQLRVYRPRVEPTSRSTGRSAPCLLEIGTIEGTLEDVMYGTHNATTRDMRVMTSFHSADSLDAAVLAVFENGCDDDRYRSFALKWRILESPAGSLVRRRDVLLLEYMGIARDSNGERYAFHICDSVDHPVCPPFHPQSVARAKTLTRILYRQIRPGSVGVYYCADNTSGGRVPKMLFRWTLIEVAVSVGRIVECAEAKKLTAIALAAHATEESKQVVQRREQSGDSGRCCLICDEPSRRTCDVCDAHVCSRCRSRKYLLSDEGKVQILCCKQCIVTAMTMDVDPRQPLGIISASSWHTYGVIVSANTPPSPERGRRREGLPGASSAAAHSPEVASTSGFLRTNSTSACFFDMLQQSTYLNAHNVDELQTAMSTSGGSTPESTTPTDRSSDVLAHTEPKRNIAVVAVNTPIDVRTSASVQVRPARANETAGSLLQRMQQLCIVAEQTYRITTENRRHCVQ